MKEKDELMKEEIKKAIKIIEGVQAKLYHLEVEWLPRLKIDERHSNCRSMETLITETRNNLCDLHEAKEIIESLA
jgi:hypothetical protein